MRDGIQGLPFTRQGLVDIRFARRPPYALRQRALVVPDKAERVHNFHRNTLKALAELLAAAGLEKPDQLEPQHLVRRISDTEVRNYSQVHVFLKPGDLLVENIAYPFYKRLWEMARADSFEVNRG